MKNVYTTVQKYYDIIAKPITKTLYTYIFSIFSD